jgi:hypothetical protein
VFFNQRFNWKGFEYVDCVDEIFGKVKEIVAEDFEIVGFNGQDLGEASREHCVISFLIGHQLIWLKNKI